MTTEGEPRLKMKFSGSTFTYKKERLETLHVEPERSRKTRVIIAPGLAESAGTFMETGRELAKNGREVLVLSPQMKYTKSEIQKTMKGLRAEVRSRYQGLNEDVFNALWKSLPVGEVAKAFALIAYAEGNRREGERFDGIGHSQGGANLLIAAFLRPDLFGRIVLVNPAGQSGKEKVLLPGGLFWRFFYALIKESKKKGKRHLLTEAAHFLLLRQMLVRATKEAYGLASFNAFPLLYALSFAEPPVMRTTVYDSADPIFKKDDVERAERDVARGARTKDTHEPHGNRHVSQDMGHYHPITHPDEFALLIEKLLP